MNAVLADIPWRNQNYLDKQESLLSWGQLDLVPSRLEAMTQGISPWDISGIGRKQGNTEI